MSQQVLKPIGFKHKCLKMKTNNYFVYMNINLFIIIKDQVIVKVIIKDS